MMLGGSRPQKPEGSGSGSADFLLGALQASVDRARADRLAARTVPCDRPRPHPEHDYVATAKSGIDLHCTGEDPT